MGNSFVETAGVHFEGGEVAESLLPDRGGSLRIAREPLEASLRERAAAALIRLTRRLEDELRIRGIGGLVGEHLPIAGPPALDLNERVHPALLGRRALLTAAFHQLRGDDDPRGRAADPEASPKLFSFRGRHVLVERHLVARVGVERRGGGDERLHAFALAAIGLHEEDQDAPVAEALRALDGFREPVRPKHFEARSSRHRAALLGLLRGGRGLRWRRGGWFLGETGQECQKCQKSEHHSLSVDYSRRATYNAQAPRGPSLRKRRARGAGVECSMACPGSSVGRARA